MNLEHAAALAPCLVVFLLPGWSLWRMMQGFGQSAAASAGVADAFEPARRAKARAYARRAGVTDARSR